MRQSKWHMELKLRLLGLLWIVVSRLIKVVASGICSAKAKTLVKNQQCLQANHHVWIVEESTECGALDVSRTLESRNVGMSRRTSDFVSVAWQAIMKEELVLRLDLVKVMVVKEVVITYCMALRRLTQRTGEWCLHGRGPSAHIHTSTSKQETAIEAFSLRTMPVWLKANDRKAKVNVMLDDGSNETFLNEEVAGVLGLRERYHTANVLNNEVETFQSMPFDVTIESLDGEFSKDIKVKTRG